MRVNFFSGVSSTTVATLKTTNNPLSEQCTIAIAICQVKCRTGFMTDPNDCTFCRCKAEIETACKLILSGLVPRYTCTCIIVIPSFTTLESLSNEL